MPYNHFLKKFLKALPKGSILELKQQIIRDNMAYMYGAQNLIFVSIPNGADTFIMDNDKIIFQNLVAHIILKQ
jgi:hypothetical protein